MLLEIIFNFLVSGSHLVFQLLLRIRLGQDSSLFKFHLQVDGTFFIGAGGNSSLFADQDLSQLTSDLLQLFVRNLTTSQLRVFGFCIIDELVKLRLVSRLLEKLIYFLFGDIRTRWARTLRFEIVFGYDDSAHQIKLPLHFWFIADAFGASF